MKETIIGKLLALDVGLARIGVATCDPLGLATRPITVIHRKSRREDFDRLANLVRVEGVDAVICGLPLSMDGSDSAQTQTIRKWAMRLAHALRTILGHPMTVVLWDERLSTFAAQEIMRSGKAQKRFGEDAVAAAVILQSYLDAVRKGDESKIERIELPARESPETEHAIN